MLVTGCMARSDFLEMPMINRASGSEAEQLSDQTGATAANALTLS